MPRKPDKAVARHQPRSSSVQGSISGPWLWCAVVSSGLWFVTATSISSRIHLVMGYTTIASGPPALEAFLASGASWLFSLAVAGVWLLGYVRRTRFIARPDESARWSVVGWFGASALPAVASGLRAAEIAGAPLYWEPLWFAGLSGISMGVVFGGLPRMMNKRLEPSPLGQADVSGVQSSVPAKRFGLEHMGATWVALAAAVAASWWFWQSSFYFDNFLLGFNDVGHFAMRIANTSAGRGILLETPVLPPFWDHFNPGLLALVPLWSVFPDVHLFFALQAIALAGSAVCVWAIARRLQHGQPAAVAFALAWLAQPVLGQMNLAYTYGWHPISLAIPFMLAAVWGVLAKRYGWASVLCLAAMSMEEGVIVVVALFCATSAALGYWPLRTTSSSSGGVPVILGVSAKVWAGWSVATIVLFVVVYRFSGLAEFQTGRFVVLGDTAWEVLLSPVLRPGLFWGSLLRWDKLAFCLSLWLPCGLPALWLGWRWLLPSCLPLLVLLVWDHKPAASLAFQYSSTLLPVFWFAAMQGAPRQSTSLASAALTTGLVLSLFVGQLPYSSPTLLDVIGQTYGVDEEQGDSLRRQAEAADGRWLHEQLAVVRADGGEVLATGRIATHLVGNRDVETVGQFWERRDKLARLPDRAGEPLLHYRWIVLDRRESFQQRPEQSQELEQAALELGFTVHAEAHDILFLRR